jgi:hypothetical protein
MDKCIWCDSGEFVGLCLNLMAGFMEMEWKWKWKWIDLCAFFVIFLFETKMLERCVGAVGIFGWRLRVNIDLDGHYNTLLYTYSYVCP